MAMEFVAKRNFSIEIGFTSLEFISFEKKLGREFKSLDFNSFVIS